MIYCVACQSDVDARLTSGKEIYPHRKDLAELPFWRCDTCKNYVGCHHKTADRTKPLGVIPTKELMRARGMLHRVIDPIWKSGRMTRRDLYAEMARRLGIPEYHTAEVSSIDDARKAWVAARVIAEELK